VIARIDMENAFIRMLLAVLTIVLVTQHVFGYLVTPQGSYRRISPYKSIKTRLYGSLDEPVWSSAVSTNNDLNEAILEVLFPFINVLIFAFTYTFTGYK